MCNINLKIHTNLSFLKKFYLTEWCLSLCSFFVIWLPQNYNEWLFRNIHETHSDKFCCTNNKMKKVLKKKKRLFSVNKKRNELDTCITQHTFFFLGLKMSLHTEKQHTLWIHNSVDKRWLLLHRNKHNEKLF